MSSIFPIPSLEGQISGKLSLKGEVSPKGSLSGSISSDIKRTDYESQVYNKPRINDVELIGNLTFEDLGHTPITPQEIDEIIFGGDD